MWALALGFEAAAANEAAPTWQAVPQGSFVFGCADEAPTPQQKKPAPTAVRPFWITVHRLTTANYRSCVDARRCRPLSAGATAVPYLQAARFCRWLGARLPTEIEWEFLADRDAAKVAADRLVDVEGGSEWVVGPRDLWAMQENTRGGIADLEPLRRCEAGFADGDLEHGDIGFRCVREAPPPLIGDAAGHPRADVKRTLRAFEMRGTALRLHQRLSVADAAATFVGCPTALAPLGSWRSSTTERVEAAGGLHDVEVHLYDAPCRDPLFVLTAPDARAGTFVARGVGPTFSSPTSGRVTFTPAQRVEGKAVTPCAIVGPDSAVEVPGEWETCALRLAADLNGDDAPDFLIEARDVCTSAALVVSDAGHWRIVALDAVWCPD
jgi:hypothetical protein